MAELALKLPFFRTSYIYTTHTSVYALSEKVALTKRCVCLLSRDLAPQ